MRIIVIEDELRLANTLRQGLMRHGFEVDIKNDGKEAFEYILQHHALYDLCILDILLPQMNGLEICKMLRQQNIGIPILVLTAKDKMEDKIEALSAGAHDYMTKPFSLAELVVRINELLGTPHHSYPTKLLAQNIELDAGAHQVFRDGKEILLTVKEFALLEIFMRNANQVLNRERILSQIWDFNYNPFSNVVDVHIKNLRKKLGKTPFNEDYIQTISGVGYRFKG